MGFFEKITFPVYSWDRNRGKVSNIAAFHCRILIAEMLFFCFFDLYEFFCFLMKKYIFISNRFLFDKAIDFYILGILSFIISIVITSNKKWEETYLSEDQQNSNIVGAFFIFMSPLAIAVFIGYNIK